MSKTTKLPALQFYPGDWKKDIGVQSLSMHDRGVWLEILFLMHDSSRRGVLLLGDKAMPVEVLARILGMPKESLDETLEHLVSYGVTERETRTGALVNRRMLRDENERAESRGRLNKWRKAKKAKDNGNAEETVSETDLKRLSSSSTSSSSSASTRDTSDDDKIDASMAVSGVIQMADLHSRDARIVLDSMAREVEKKGEDLGAWADTLVRSWQEFEKARPRLEYHWSAAKFFGEGHYKNPDGWPWKQDQRPKKKLRAVNE